MSQGGADYSQWTSEEMVASFKYHNSHPKIWTTISDTFDVTQLDGWQAFELKQRSVWRRRYVTLWFRNRLVLLVGLVFMFALIVSPAALVGEQFGLIGGAFLVVAPIFLVGLVGSHPEIHAAARRLFATEVKSLEKIVLLDTSISMVEARVRQLNRWRELAE